MSEREQRPDGGRVGSSTHTNDDVGFGAGALRLLSERYGAAAAQRYVQRRRAQRKANAEGAPPAHDADVHAAAAQGISGAGQALPHADAIQRSFGRHDVSGIQAHTDGAAQAGARSMGAEAYATGDHVAFAGAPDLHTAAHEAAHVVQQRAGVHLKGGVGAEGDSYEQHADAVADRVVQGQSAEALLDQHAGGGQAHAAGGGGPVQHKMKPDKVWPVLSNLMDEHELSDVYKQMWSSGEAKRICSVIAEQEDTDKDNVKRRLTDHPDVKKLLINHRLELESKEPDLGKVAPHEADPAHLAEVLRAFRALVCFHASKSAEGVRETGLDPNRGGHDEGLSATRSLAGKKEQNVKASKNRVFVTRKESEARGYADGKMENIVMLLVPRELQGELEVDPDSQKGVMGGDHLKGVVQTNLLPNWWGAMYLQKEIADENARANWFALWKVLLAQNAIRP